MRVLVRDATSLAGRPWLPEVEVAVGDLDHPSTLPPALSGIDVAYFLVHGLYERRFEEREARWAHAFAAAARDARVGHVVYLGGLVPRGRLSPHLRSRARVGEILRAKVPTTEFRAGPIVGSGSASFEMVRYLTERLPVMVTPRWVGNAVSPIAIRDVLSYLLLALEREPVGVVEIGAQPLTFRAMMEHYAEVRGLRRVILPVPVLAPRLAALWVGLVTPIPTGLAAHLVEGMLAPLLADTRRARELFPEIEPMPYRQAVELALQRIALGEVETRWSGASAGHGVRLEDREGLIREERVVRVRASAEDVFRVFCGLGGDRGWLVWDWAWEVRGFLDRLVGGPGLRRGRRDPDVLLPGEAVDFWRVEAVEAPHLLRLRAEMRLPGRAWLEWRAVPDDRGTLLVQTAYFEPKGLLGFSYWWSLYPIHRRIFSDLVSAIAERAEAGAAAKAVRGLS